MNVGRRWALAAAIVVIGTAMTMAIACGSDNNDNNSDNTPAATQMNETPSETMADQTPSETMTDQTPGETMAANEVHISEKEYQITGLDGGAITSAQAGNVTFEVHNDGTIEHVFYVFKTDTDPANLPLNGNEVDEANAGTDVGEIEGVPAGSIKMLTIDLQPGKYVLICNRPGHYQQGMHAAFVVQ